jgi:hypothetical protein
VPRANLIKSTFTSGVLDPRLYSRVDTTHYERGLQAGDNVVVTPYGGVRRRGGFRRVDELSSDSGINVRLVPFSYNSNADQYVLAFTVQGGVARICFFKNGAPIMNINGSGNPYIASPWAASAYAGLRWAQTADVMVMVHEDYAPRTIVRGAADNLWTITTITFTNVPQVDFNDGASPVPVSEVQTITFGGAPAVGNTYRIDLEGVLTETITWAGDGSASEQAANITRLTKALSKLYNTGDGDIVVARTGALTYTVTFQNGAARNYDLMTGFGVTGTITLAIAPTANGSPRTEPLWSAGRGYARSVCFWENRLVFGGFKSKPQTVAMSATNDPYNFNTGEGLDDDAILRTLETDQVNKIVAVVPSKHLQVFTEGAEFYFPDQPLTPAASGVIPQTTYGCNGVRPVELDGATLFLDEEGRGLRQFLYSDIEQAYQAPSASRLSSALINAPVAMATTQASADDEGSYLFVVNADGTVAVMMSERSEEILAWTRWTTLGEIKDVCVLTDEVYFIVRYNSAAAGANRYDLVLVDSGYYMDDAEQLTAGAPTVTFAGVNGRLNGVALRLRGDNGVMPDEAPVAGVLTVDWPVTTLQWGLNFDVTVTPMPGALVSNYFAGVNRRARLGRCQARVKSTLGMKINGYPMDERRLDVDPLDTAPDALSGVVEVCLGGWGTGVAPVVTQTDPLPLQLLSLEYELEMH